MEPFSRICGAAAPIEGRSVDTDQIIPARFLKADRAKGYGQFLFHDARFDAAGREKPDYVLNREPFRNAPILVADDNFGCGSSREAAVYALHDYGVRAVIAPSFGDIFYNNSLRNGIVPVRLERDVVAGFLDALAASADPQVCVDLDRLELTGPGGSIHPFSIDPFWRECMLKGVDEIELTRGYLREIEAFERDYEAEMAWAAPDAAAIATTRT